MAQCHTAAFGAYINFMAEFYKKHEFILFSKPCHGKTWTSYLLPMTLVPYKQDHVMLRNRLVEQGLPFMYTVRLKGWG